MLFILFKAMNDKQGSILLTIHSRRPILLEVIIISATY